MWTDEWLSVGLSTSIFINMLGGEEQCRKPVRAVGLPHDYHHHQERDYSEVRPPYKHLPVKRVPIGAAAPSPPHQKVFRFTPPLVLNLILPFPFPAQVPNQSPTGVEVGTLVLEGRTNTILLSAEFSTAPDVPH